MAAWGDALEGLTDDRAHGGGGKNDMEKEGEEAAGVE